MQLPVWMGSVALCARSGPVSWDVPFPVGLHEGRPGMPTLICQQPANVIPKLPCGDAAGHPAFALENIAAKE